MPRIKARPRRHVGVQSESLPQPSSAAATTPSSSAPAATSGAPAVRSRGGKNRGKYRPTSDWRPQWVAATISEEKDHWISLASVPSRPATIAPKDLVSHHSPVVSEHSVQILHWDPCAIATPSHLRHVRHTGHWLDFTAFAEDSRLLSVRAGSCTNAEVSLPPGVPACLAFCARLGCAAVTVNAHTGLVRFFLRVLGHPISPDSDKTPEDYLSMYPVGVLLRWAAAVASITNTTGTCTGEAHDQGQMQHRNYISPGNIAQRKLSLDASWVYAAVRRTKNDLDAAHYLDKMDLASSNVLNVTLRPYQTRAVAWMLSRELGPRVHLSRWTPSASVRNAAVPAFEFETMQQTVREYIQPSERAEKEVSDSACRGGLLCDAMGLGKTVEFLQLIALNKLPPGAEGNPQCAPRAQSKLERCLECTGRARFGFVNCRECHGRAHFDCSGGAFDSAYNSFVCSRCCNEITKFSRDNSLQGMPLSRATLIIVPSPLLSQWKAEVKRHVGSALHIIVFEGSHATGYVPQRELLTADVVITSYATLRHDVNIARSLNRRNMSLRHPKRYRPTPIPLLGVQWWRVALDEAQMLGVGASAAVEMTKMLASQFRWCITGTPVSKSITDLTAILNVLNIGRGFNPLRWKERLIEPARLGFDSDRENLKFALRQVMWRTEKDGLSDDELVLPPQEVQVVRVNLGPVERYHYTDLYIRSREIALERLARRSDDITLATQMILCLRQACCHPQVGSSGQRLIIRNSHTRTVPGANAPTKRRRLNPKEAAKRRSQNPMTMSEVLDSLLEKARFELSEVFRQLVSDYNGFAGVLLLRQGLEVGKPDLPVIRAIGLYRQILRMASEHKEHITMDKIQRMHVIHNLDEALNKADSLKLHFLNVPGAHQELQALRSIGKTLQESSLKEELENLKNDYIFVARNRLEEDNASLTKCTETVVDKAYGPHIDPRHVPALPTAESEHNLDEGELPPHVTQIKSLESETPSDAVHRDALENVERNAQSHPEPKITENLSMGTEGSENNVELNGDTDDPEAEDAKKKSEGVKKPCRERIWWWERAIGIVKESKETKIFLLQLCDILTRKRDARKFRFEPEGLPNACKSLISLHRELRKQLTHLANARKKMVTCVWQLPGSEVPSQADILQSGQCSKCRDMGDGVDCKHCKAEPVLKAVERLLYFLPKAAGGNKRKLQNYADLDDDFTDDSSDEESHRRVPLRVRNASVISRGLHTALRSRSATTKLDETQCDGIRLKSEIEEVLQALLGATKSKMDALTLREAEMFMEQFKELKKEFDACKSLIEAQRNYLGSLDEVNMALTRITLVDDSASPTFQSHIQQRFSITRQSLPSIEAEFRGYKTRADNAFKDKRSRVGYLLSMKETGSEEQGGQAVPGGMDKCAVCLTPHPKKMGMFECGHQFCSECTMALIDKVPGLGAARGVPCPICRKDSIVDNVKYFSRGVSQKCMPCVATPSSSRSTGDDPSSADPRSAGKNCDGCAVDAADSTRAGSSETSAERQTPSPSSVVDTDRLGGFLTRRPVVYPHMALEKRSTFCNENVRIEGFAGAKLTAIVRVLKTILQRDPSAKALVFSHWTEVLGLISGTLSDNHVAHIGGDGHSTKSIESSVRSFKDGDANVLLLPLRRAGAGLNLTEATHVLLVEPSLNAALEAQAVGRVHRIGQTKPTFVHRFVTSDSIEDRVLHIAANRTAESQSVDEKVSVGDVIELFNEAAARPAEAGDELDTVEVEGTTGAEMQE